VGKNSGYFNQHDILAHHHYANSCSKQQPRTTNMYAQPPKFQQQMASASKLASTSLQ
jgi:hypothetical protein